MNYLNWPTIKYFLNKNARKLLIRLNLNSNIIVYSFLDSLNNFSNSNLYNWKYYFKSRHKKLGLANGDVACIMCTWGEELITPLAIESSKNFVSKYIVVDKDGETVPVIEACRDKWDLDMEIYIKPKMSLREARSFALTRIEEPWILIQDGDEIFHTDGPNSIYNLRRFMNRPHTILMTTMNCLCGDIWHTSATFPQQPYHMFLYHNNGTLKAPSFQWDLPIMKGWKIYLTGPFKFNCSIKSPKRIFLRQFWKKWCQDTKKYITYPNIEDYVTDDLNINIEIEFEKWYKKYFETLILYDEEKFGYYPKVIRKKAHSKGAHASIVDDELKSLKSNRVSQVIGER